MSQCLVLSGVRHNLDRSEHLLSVLVNLIDEVSKSFKSFVEFRTELHCIGVWDCCFQTEKKAYCLLVVFHLVGLELTPPPMPPKAEVKHLDVDQSRNRSRFLTSLVALTRVTKKAALPNVQSHQNTPNSRRTPKYLCMQRMIAQLQRNNIKI